MDDGWTDTEMQEHHGSPTHRQLSESGSTNNVHVRHKSASTNCEDSPLSPPMPWSREGTSEEWSKYQGMQTQQNDSHHHRSTLGRLPSTPTNTAKLVANAHLSSRDNVSVASDNSEGRKGLERGTLSTSRTSSSTKTRGQGDPSEDTGPKSGRTSTKSSRPTKTKSLPSEEKRDSTLTASSTTDRINIQGSPQCQRHRVTGSGKKVRCRCVNCQNNIITPPQRPYRYGQFLGNGIGSTEPSPIYSGPLGLGDDIPSPTPSPPLGRLSIHMAMASRASPINSPSGSPLLSRSSFNILTTSPSTNKSPSPRIKSKSSKKSTGDDSEHSQESNNSNSTDGNSTGSSGVSGGGTRDVKVKSKKSSKSTPTQQHQHHQHQPQVFLEATPLSTSPSSPLSPPYPSSPTSFSIKGEKDTSPSLSPFFLSKRSFSPPSQVSSLTSALSSSPPIHSDPTLAHHLFQSASFGSTMSHNQRPMVSSTDFPRLAPPVVLVQSPTAESLASLSEGTSRFMANERSPLLYSSVLASTTSSASASSTVSSTAIPTSNFSQTHSPSHQPLSPTNRQSTAATPPLSPSRKKEGPLPSVFSALDKKEFEAWSIDDRMIRPMSTIQQKSALLAANLRDKGQRSTHESHPSQQHNNTTTSPRPQPQHHLDASLSSQSVAQNQSSTNTPDSPIRRQWQLRSYSAVSKESADRAGRKTASNTITNRKSINGNHTSLSGSGSTTQGSTQSAAKEGGGGSSLYTLRRTRSAPILASGQLSYADILKASIKATSTPTLPSLGAASSPNLTSSPSPLLSASVASGTISSSSTSSANDSGSYKSRLIASLTPTRSMKPLRRPSLFNSKSDNNIKERLEKARVEAAKSGATPLKSLLSLEPTDGPSSGSSNSSSTETGERGFSESSTMEIDDKSEYSEESSCQENEKGQGEIDMTDYTSSEDVEMTTCDTTLETVVEVGALDLNSSFVRSPLSVGLHTNGRTKKGDMSTASSPEALRRFQSVVAGSMMDIQDQEVTEVVVDRTADKSGAMAVGQQVDVSLRKAEASLEHKEPLRSSTNTVQPQQQQPAESLVEEVCPFQQQLALQEQTALEIEQQQAEEDAKNNHGRLGGSFKSRRKRNSSAGGKKLQLKKKLSLPNLHISFQQSRQDSPTLMSLKRLESGGLSATTPMTPASVIPPFYFPLGRPVAATKRRQRVHSAVTKAKEIFAVAESGALAEDGFVVITVQCCELPRYMNRALFRKADLSGSGEVRFQEFERVWESLVETCPDEISMIFMILKQPSANVLTPTDFEVVLQDLVLFHPGLEFLAGNSVFQERYLETVITRIFYEANRRHGKMSLADLRKSGFEKTLRKLENSDLNQTEDCFSYKHFYVIYCKFWELDQDHDLILDEKDLTGYAGGAISSRVIRRVMQGYGNETGMFMVPDQEILFLQQQQVLIQQQQQQQQQQLQQQAASQIQTQDQSMEQAQDTGAVAVNMDVDQELATAIEAIVRDGASDGALKDQINYPSDLGTPSLDGATTRIDSPMTGASESTLMARSTPPGPGSSCRPQNYRMTYKGFIWFLLAETDKQTVTSIEYWFRCMDLDGDGILTVFELEQLFQEQAQRMSILGMESFGFRDAICQMQDLVSPRDCGWVRLADLKQCGQAGPFIDLFCNVVRWRAFEAHQHQIRMRQQQIAMQRAADAAWEEVASGEEIFDDDDDEEDGEDGDDDGDDEEDDYDEDYDDDDEEEEGFGEDFDDEEEIEVSGGQALLRQKDLLLRNTKASMSTTDVSMVESESGGSIRGSKSSPLLSSALDQEANCIGLGVEMVQHVELENNGRENHQGGRRVTKVIVDESAPSSQSFHDASLEQASGGQMMPNKTLRRTRTKEKRRRQKSLVRRALLEEQRKEKALLATIRESPWLVYVEAEYEKLVTIERPQSRTGWEQDEEDEEEDEEEEEEEIEDEVDEEEVMEEEEMMEQGREGTPGQAQAATAAAIGQNLSSKHIDIEDANLLASLSDSEGEGGVPKAVVSGKMTTTTTTGSAIFEIGHDFEQISMDNGSMD